MKKEKILKILSIILATAIVVVLVVVIVNYFKKDEQSIGVYTKERAILITREEFGLTDDVNIEVKELEEYYLVSFTDSNNEVKNYSINKKTELIKEAGISSSKVE